MDIEESDVPTFAIGVPVLLERRDTVDTATSKPVDIAHRVLSRENVWTGEFSPASSNSELAIDLEGMTENEEVLIPALPGPDDTPLEEEIIECSKDFNCDIPSHSQMGIFHPSHTHPFTLHKYLPQILVILTMLQCSISGEDSGLGVLSCLLCHAIGMNFTSALQHMRTAHGKGFGNPTSRQEANSKIREIRRWRLANFSSYTFQSIVHICIICS
jgi:hypothetical protein